MSNVNTHLGRTASGEERPAYVTPKQVDPSLLVPLPREASRVEHGIQGDNLKGYDRWNCYEFSTRLRSGFPLTGKLVIVYPASTQYIVESKSLKLYLNSYNLDIMPVDTPDVLQEYIAGRIRLDLEDIGIVCTVVRLDLDHLDVELPRHNLFKFPFFPLEKELDYRQTPNNELDVIPVPDTDKSVLGYTMRVSASIRSNCKVTNQPDWGTCYIAIKPDRRIMSLNSIFNLLTSFRQQNHFHEEVCEMLYNDLNNLLKPNELLVACNYLRRGGIDINPVRASSYTLLQDETHSPFLIDVIPDLRQ